MIFAARQLEEEAGEQKLPLYAMFIDICNIFKYYKIIISTRSPELPSGKYLRNKMHSQDSFTCSDNCMAAYVHNRVCCDRKFSGKFLISYDMKYETSYGFGVCHATSLFAMLFTVMLSLIVPKEYTSTFELSRSAFLIFLQFAPKQK